MENVGYSSGKYARDLKLYLQQVLYHIHIFSFLLHQSTYHDPKAFLILYPIILLVIPVHVQKMVVYMVIEKRIHIY